ncbi:MAG: hypothetical protein LH631_05885 [Alkalinema sp. CAN_BIN05]|nr:hypothetical protein [Alkalinema sp. CAN_BIN05]
MNRRQFLAALGLTTAGTIAQNSRAMANSPAWIPSDRRQFQANLPQPNRTSRSEWNCSIF